MILTPKRLFSMMARYFENAADRREQDGAFLASLVTSTTLEVDDYFFVQREVEDERFDVSNVRRFFMKGQVVRLAGNEIITEVDMNEEKDSFWELKFFGAEVDVQNVGVVNMHQILKHIVIKSLIINLWIKIHY